MSALAWQVRRTARIQRKYVKIMQFHPIIVRFSYVNSAASDVSGRRACSEYESTPEVRCVFRISETSHEKIIDRRNTRILFDDKPLLLEASEAYASGLDVRRSYLSTATV